MRGSFRLEGFEGSYRKDDGPVGRGGCPDDYLVNRPVSGGTEGGAIIAEHHMGARSEILDVRMRRVGDDIERQRQGQKYEERSYPGATMSSKLENTHVLSAH